MAAILGAIIAAPVVVAYVGERLTGFKGFGVEISLATVTVDVAEDDSITALGLANLAMPSQEAQFSAAADLSGPFRTLIQHQSKLLRLNLRNDRYWWSTRIFLVAALAQDFTNVQALVFVKTDNQQTFVGIASPQVVRARMAAMFPDYAKRIPQCAVRTVGPVSPRSEYFSQ